MITTTHTLDGEKVVPGLRVWDYDLRPRIVGKRASKWDDADPWWEMIIPDGEHAGKTGSSMNCSRMWFRHPSTGELA